MAKYLENFVTDFVTISNGTTTSNAVDLQGRGLLAIILPAAFTGSAITFQISVNNSTFFAVYNTANSQLSMTVTQGRAYAFDPSDLLCARYLKLVSGSSEGADRVITLISRVLE